MTYGVPEADVRVPEVTRLTPVMRPLARELVTAVRVDHPAAALGSRVEVVAW